MKGELLVFSGSANPGLSAEIGRWLDVEVAPATIKQFSDGEISIKLNANCRGRDVFLIQPTSSPANDHLMQMLLMLDAIRQTVTQEGNE